MSDLDLAMLPAPAIIEELGYEQAFARQMAEFQRVWSERRAAFPSENLPAYDVAMLETDPAVIASEAETFRELLLRARINDAARANLLAFARASDLDHLAAFYDVIRLPGELDARLRLRVILAIQGRSPGGPKERYKSIAMGSDIRVRSVEPYRIGKSPRIHVAVYSTEPNGIASADLLAKVRLALENDAVQLVNDEIVVNSAVRKVADLAADIWLLPNADEGVVARAEAALRSAWNLEQALGRDLVREWWVSKLMVPGMHKVTPTLPATDTSAAPYEAVAIGTVSLVQKGRAF